MESVTHGILVVSYFTVFMGYLFHVIFEVLDAYTEESCVTKVVKTQAISAICMVMVGFTVSHSTILTVTFSKERVTFFISFTCVMEVSSLNGYSKRYLLGNELFRIFVFSVS